MIVKALYVILTSTKFTKLLTSICAKDYLHYMPLLALTKMAICGKVHTLKFLEKDIEAQIVFSSTADDNLSDGKIAAESEKLICKLHSVKKLTSVEEATIMEKIFETNSSFLVK